MLFDINVYATNYKSFSLRCDWADDLADAYNVAYNMAENYGISRDMIEAVTVVPVD